MEFINIIWQVLRASGDILADSSVYVLFGLAIGGLLKAFLSPTAIARHLGRGRYAPVFKAALWGIPLPLCCCGVLPAAAALKKEGASNGAVTSFLISTPETGVDSIAVTYALMDPVMTLARPLSAFVTASATGLAQSLLEDPRRPAAGAQDLKALAGHEHDHDHDHPEDHAGGGSLPGRLRQGLAYAFGELWGDLAGWFLVGLVFTGLITVLVPEDFLARHLGGGLGTMLIMLLVGVPLYICASASTPVAAALILKGISPGAALVFLLAGPATNLTALTVLWNFMGRKATLVYLAGISVMSVLCGLALDQIYAWLGISPRALAGAAAELVPAWAQVTGALLLLGLSVPHILRRWWRPKAVTLAATPEASPGQTCSGPT
ncbi:MAG: SO_0444 family Cu/Zn efflux transporter [Desulfarculus sp.]|nr:SO_0444 family Cu/Zn efflux transporter [Desulfarculus sp.]